MHGVNLSLMVDLIPERKTLAFIMTIEMVAFLKWYRFHVIIQLTRSVYLNRVQ